MKFWRSLRFKLSALPVPLWLFTFVWSEHRVQLVLQFADLFLILSHPFLPLFEFINLRSDPTLKPWEFSLVVLSSCCYWVGVSRDDLLGLRLTDAEAGHTLAEWDCWEVVLVWFTRHLVHISDETSIYEGFHPAGWLLIKTELRIGGRAAIH